MNRIGNRTTNRHGKVNNQSYTLGGLDYYKYSLECGGKGINTLTAIHKAIAEGKDIYELEKDSNIWRKFNHSTGTFEVIKLAKEKLIDDLLQIHCNNCDGENQGCTGCSVRTDIIGVVENHIKL